MSINLNVFLKKKYKKIVSQNLRIEVWKGFEIRHYFQIKNVIVQPSSSLFSS